MQNGFNKIIGQLPSEYDGPVNPKIECLDKSIIVLDDDPTGCQTVYDVPILFSWEESLVTELLNEGTKLFLILTNTRSMDKSSAIRVIAGIMEVLEKASVATGRQYIVISRSDSTLRGHYPAEMKAIKKLAGMEDAMECLVPAFFQGGRYTYGDVHYVLEDDVLIPAAETTYSKDKAFGYHHSDLKEYVEEKTGGDISAGEVLSLPVEGIRSKGPEWVRDRILHSSAPVCIVNAMSQSDLDVFASAAWDAMHAGKKLLFRTAASFINSLACLPPREPVGIGELKTDSDRGGLILVGSYVSKTTAQLGYLLAHSDIEGVEIDVRILVVGTGSGEYISRKAIQISALIRDGKDVVVYTSRKQVSRGRDKQSLEIGELVSNALVQLFIEIEEVPGFLVVKGGITSHVIAAHGLKMKQARVAGQALPGVPVIIPDRWNIKYIIFPGNVGTEEALYELYKKLQH